MLSVYEMYQDNAAELAGKKQVLQKGEIPQVLADLALDSENDDDGIMRQNQWH